MNEINRPNVWLSCTLAALRATEDARYGDAALFWRDACAFADHLPDNDPRRAAALNNLGLSRFIAGHRDDAVAALIAARESWRIVEEWVQQVDIPSTASSSMFHFLLAANHPDVLADLRRKKYLALSAGAAAITESIWDRASERAPDPGRIQKQLQAIQTAFGEDAAAAQTLVTPAAQPPQPKRTPSIPNMEERWQSVSKNTVTEMRPLVDAAYLTVGLTSKHLDRARPYPD